MFEDSYDDDELEVVPSKKKGSRKTGTAYRRKMKVKHRERIRKNTVYSHCGYLYRPKSAYIEWGLVDGKWYPSGNFVKYPKNSHSKQFRKKQFRRAIRRSNELYRGNQYKKTRIYEWYMY